MRLPRCLAFAALALSAVLLGFGFVGEGALPWPEALIVTLLLGVFGEWRGWGWLATLAFALLIMMAAGGLSIGRPAVWMFASGIAALSAWVLGDFARRSSAAPPEGYASLLGRFLLRLAVLDVFAAGLAVLALSVHLSLPFFSALLLGIALVFGLSRVLATLRREA
jgi:hypothetical protein